MVYQVMLLDRWRIRFHIYTPLPLTDGISTVNVSKPFPISSYSHFGTRSVRAAGLLHPPNQPNWINYIWTETDESNL
jgi:hypothetical protein